MASITAHLRAMGVETPEYQQKQSLSLEAHLSELEQMQLQFSEEQYNYTEEGMLDSIWNGIKAFFKAIVDFFKRLFGSGPTKEQNATLDKTEKELDDLAKAMKDVEPEKPSMETDKILKEAGLVVDTPIRLSDIPTSSLADFEAFMMSDSDKPLTPAQFDKSLDQSERNKLTRVWLDDLAKGEQQKPARTKEEKAGERVAKRAAQVLPNDATPEQVAKVASKAVAVTDAKMRLLLDEVGRCNIPGIEYEGSKLHIALANYRIYSEKFITASVLLKEVESVADVFIGKKFDHLPEDSIAKGGFFAPSSVPLLKWSPEDKKYVFEEKGHDATPQGFVEDIFARAVLGANDYAGVVANISKNTDTKTVGALIKSVHEQITEARKTSAIYTKVLAVVEAASNTVNKIDPKTASKEEAAAAKVAASIVREIGRLTALSASNQRNALANALQAVRILRRKAGKLKEYNGLLKKLNEEVAAIKAKK